MLMVAVGLVPLGFEFLGITYRRADLEFRSDPRRRDAGGDDRDQRLEQGKLRLYGV